MNKVPKKVQTEWYKVSVKKSPAEWALKWLWNHPVVTCVLSGINNDYHIKENINTASTTEPNSLSKKEVAHIEREEIFIKNELKFHVQDALIVCLVHLVLIFHCALKVIIINKCSN